MPQAATYILLPSPSLAPPGKRGPVRSCYDVLPQDPHT